MREFNYHMAGNDRQSARERVETELALNPNGSEANFLKGRLLVLEQEYTEANTHFERSLNSSSVYREHIEYLRESHYRNEFNDGVDAWEEKDVNRAIRHLTHAIQIFPDRVEAYPVLGKAYEDRGRLGEAMEFYQDCLALDKEKKECVVNLVHTKFESGQYRATLDLISTYIENYPVNEVLHKKKVYSFFELNMYDEAEEAFETYYHHYGRYNALKQFAIELHDRDEIYRAERFFTRALSLIPGDGEVLRVLASIYLETGEYGLVIEANERLLTLYPNDKTVQKNLLNGYELAGDLDSYYELRSELELELDAEGEVR